MQLQYGEFSVANVSAKASAHVMCPLMVNMVPSELAKGYQIRSITVSYIDNAPNANQFFYCSPWQTETPTIPGPNGTVTWGENRYTCQSASGCTTPTSDTVGGGDLVWHEPFGNTVSSFQDIGLFCVIPPSNRDGSWVTAIEVSAVGLEP